MTPVLTVLTAIPAIGAGIALLAGKRASVARGIAFATALASLALALYIWFGIAHDGSMSFVEHAAWVANLGIEYHLGVDGLGALMLLLAAIVTLMSIAASRSTCQAGIGAS